MDSRLQATGGNAGGLSESVFAVPDEMVRPLARRISRAHREAGEVSEPGEDWFAGKVTVYEHPETVIEVVESDPNVAVAFRRSSTLREAYRQVREWDARLKHVPLEERACSAQDCERPNEFFPIEWIQAKAFERFEHRGREHGRDREDWFAAKAQLFESFVPLMLRDSWSAELWQSLCAKPLKQAIDWLEELMSKPDMTSGISHSRLLLDGRESKMQPVIKTFDPTPEDNERAEAAKIPGATLTQSELSRYKGCLVALLADGADKGTVVAYAPLNLQNPQEPRKKIQGQIAASRYKGRRYQVRQILENPSAK